MRLVFAFITLVFIACGSGPSPCGPGACSAETDGGSNGGGGGGGGAGGGSGVGGGSTGGGGVVCAAPLVACAGACVDARLDSASCGACDLKCPIGSACVDGRCATLPTDCSTTPCPALGFYCDLSTKACRPGCIVDSQCAAPLGTCDTTTRTCGCSAGSCGASSYCTPQRTCAAGCEADAQCAAPSARCDLSKHQCVACTTDAHCSGATPHCSSTNRCVSCVVDAQCPAPVNGTPSCSAANTCSSSCRAGFHACGALCLDDASPQSCGTSCTPCAASPNGFATCTAGACGVMCAAGHSPLAGQCVRSAGWVVKSGQGPTSRTGATASASSNGVIVFGGKRNDLKLDQTWRWNGTAWTLPQVTTRPSARSDHAMAYDSVRDQVVLVGGETTVAVGDTWVWNGSWVNTNQTIPPRAGASMAFDSQRAVMVLFGGDATGETYEWNGSFWARRTDLTTKPPALRRPSLAYDSVRKRVVLFGGIISGLTASNATWEYDGQNWQLRSPTVSPPARGNAGMVFDASLQRIVLFGGSGSPNFDDTWTYDGTTWAKLPLSTAPLGRAYHGMAYDPARQRIVVMPGMANPTGVTEFVNDTWEY